MINSPEDLLNLLIVLFPDFSYATEEKQEWVNDGFELSFHAVLQWFAPDCRKYLVGSSKNQVSEFCVLINGEIEQGGDVANAFSTCLLEHASQVGIKDLLKTQLNSRAIAELR